MKRLCCWPMAKGKTPNRSFDNLVPCVDMQPSCPGPIAIVSDNVYSALLLCTIFYMLSFRVYWSTVDSMSCRPE